MSPSDFLVYTCGAFALASVACYYGGGVCTLAYDQNRCREAGELFALCAALAGVLAVVARVVGL